VQPHKGTYLPRAEDFLYAKCLRLISFSNLGANRSHAFVETPKLTFSVFRMAHLLCFSTKQELCRFQYLEQPLHRLPTFERRLNETLHELGPRELLPPLQKLEPELLYSPFGLWIPIEGNFDGPRLNFLCSLISLRTCRLTSGRALGYKAVRPDTKRVF